VQGKKKKNQGGQGEQYCGGGQNGEKKDNGEKGKMTRVSV